jgi:hypothetical protein
VRASAVPPKNTTASGSHVREHSQQVGEQMITADLLVGDAELLGDRCRLDGVQHALRLLHQFACPQQSRP